MKKILYLTIIAIAALTACKKQSGTPSTGIGELSLSVTYKSDDLNDKLMLKSNTEIDITGFTVVINKLQDEWGATSTWSQTWTLAEFPEVLELAPGLFRITVASPAAERLATDKPTFYVQEEFTIREDEVTPLELVCGVSNMKVTMAPTENFFTELKNYVITVSGEYEGIEEKVSVSWSDIDFTQNAEGKFVTDKVAYFEPVQLEVMVTGVRKVDNSDVALKEPFIISDVAPKDNHILNIDVQVTGEVKQLSLITISTELNDSKDYELNIPGFEETPIPDEDEEGNQSMDTSLEWPANDKKYDPVELIVSTDENGENTVTLGTPVKLTVKCPRKIKSFIIEVSENFKAIIPMISGGPDYLDLINNQTLIDFFVGPMYLPTGDELKGQTEVEFDLSSLASLVPTIANEDGEETVFTLKITDERNNVYVENIYFKTVIVKGE